MRFGMMAAVGMLAATAGMAHGERENGKSWSVPNYSAMYYVDQLDTAKAQTVMVAQAPVAGRERAMGVCLAVEMATKDWVNPTSFSPASDAAHYMEFFAKQPLTSFLPFDSIRITQQPSYGTLMREKNAVGRDVYVYRPNVGYLGKDRIEVVVPVGSDTVRIIYNFVVQPNPTEREDFNNRKYCPKTEWKISSTFTTPNFDNAALQALLDATGINNTVTVNTADLSGGAVGQTTGSAITLDTTAANYGWYIDYTPYLNDEYLPTSNPNVWVAKAGTEAAGKMDMLSVLLHEYGHALGIEHSADSGDYMAATLQPGVRRMPSSEELARMARLVAGVKANYGSGISDEVPAPKAPVRPQEPGIPTPNRGHHTVRTARARISRFGTTILNADGSDRSESQPSQHATASATQYAIVANPTLTDATLQTGTGWESTGSVAIGNGAATLSETTRSQTRLNQVFTIGPNDRYLSFTLADIGLDDIENGPDDNWISRLHVAYRHG